MSTHPPPRPYADAPPHPAHRLSAREIQVLRHVTEGRTNRQIGHVLSICEKTVEFHLKNIYDKLDVGCRTEAAIWAVRHLDPQDLGITLDHGARPRG